MKTVITISPGLWILFEASVSAEHGQVGRVTPSTESEDSNKRDGRPPVVSGPPHGDRASQSTEVLPLSKSYPVPSM